MRKVDSPDSRETEISSAPLPIDDILVVAFARNLPKLFMSSLVVA